MRRLYAFRFSVSFYRHWPNLLSTGCNARRW